MRLGLISALIMAAGAIASPGAALAAPGNGNSAATTTGSFSDSCGDFAAHSSKDISHAEIHYADGRVVKDESVDGQGFSLDGVATDAIASVIVKSGTTSEHFACESPIADSPPIAGLERRAGAFDHQNVAGTWTDTDCHWDFVNNPETTFCTYGSGVGESTVSFRGTGSTDPDDDILSWSIDFGDGSTPASGTWATDPPAEVTHDYGQLACVCTVVLTATDSAGHSNSDPMLVDVDNDGFD
jgi:hypothetical protein